MFHWLVKWKRYNLQLQPSVSVADNAEDTVSAVDGILAVVTSFAVGGCYLLNGIDLHLLLLYCL
jgi:hypothetical protein